MISMESPKSTLKNIHGRCERNTSWNEIMQLIVSAQASDGNVIQTYPLKVFLKNKINDFPKDISWDNAIEVIIESTIQYQNSTESVIDTENIKDVDKKESYNVFQIIKLILKILLLKLSKNYSKNNLIGRYFKLLSFFFIATGIIILGWWESTKTETSGWPIAFFLLFVIILKLGMELHKRGRFYLQKLPKIQSYQNDTHPVIYLRAFRDDLITNETKVMALTEEEQIVRVLSEIGPVIALDNPSDDSKIPGSFRLKALDTEWQEKVRNLVTQANLVVIRPAMTPAIHWELELVRNCVDPKKVLLIIPSENYLNYEIFTQHAEKNLQIHLPDLKKEKNILKNIFRILTRTPEFGKHFSFESFVYFNDHWRGYKCYPNFSMNSFLRSPLTGSGHASIKFALKPVFNNLNVPWNNPPFNLITVMVILLFVCGTIAGILGYQ